MHEVLNIIIGVFNVFALQNIGQLTQYAIFRYYDNPEHLKELGGIDIKNYIASSIVVFNLDTKQVKWIKELDLSTDKANFRAYIYSSPTVVDLDGDGYLDILVGTSFGLFYAMDHRGKSSCYFLLFIFLH